MSKRPSHDNDMMDVFIKVIMTFVIIGMWMKVLIL